jgi:purine-binding chemotaxis protein CheW
MPDRLEHANNQEHGPLSDLPLGGLLSELLASEGVDPANIAEEAMECGVSEQPFHVSPESVTASSPPVDPAPPEDGSEAWLESGIAMPGLLADLFHLDQAARQPDVVAQPVAEPEAWPAAAAPNPAKSGISTQLSVEAGPQSPAEPAALECASTPPEFLPPETAPEPKAESLSAPETGPGGPNPIQAEPAEAEPEVAGFDGLAIPGLFSLLSAETEPAGQAPEEQSAPEMVDGRPCSGQALEPSGAPATEQTGSIRSLPPEQQAAPQEAATPLQATVEPAGVEPSILAGDDLDILYFEDEEELDSSRQAVTLSEPSFGLLAEPLPMPDPAAAVVLAPAVEPAALAMEPPESAAPAALSAAPATPQNDTETVEKIEQTPDQSELTRLIGQIDREIACSPVAPAEVVQRADKDFERFVVFRLGGNSYGLHMKLVREVDKAGKVTAVPSAPAILRGLINLRGEILPLIDPRPLLGLEPAGWSGGGYLVVVQARGDEMPVALLVDELGGVAPVDPASVAPIYRSDDLKAGLAGHVLGQAEHRGRSVLLLDHRRLVTDEALLDAVESRGMELEEAGR